MMRWLGTSFHPPKFAALPRELSLTLNFRSPSAGSIPRSTVNCVLARTSILVRGLLKVLRLSEVLWRRAVDPVAAGGVASSVAGAIPRLLD